MTAALEILNLIIIVTVAFLGLAIAIRWTQYLADWLWLIPHAPRTTMAATIASVILLAIALSIVTQIALDGPLALAIELVLMPFVAVQAANYCAFQLAWQKTKEKPEGSWRTFIVDARRAGQRAAYEAPPTEQI
jgi:FlaA1/EpsC-like NDP-sugar epimerase